jgi:signal transduction histidine kinase
MKDIFSVLFVFIFSISMGQNPINENLIFDPIPKYRTPEQVKKDYWEALRTISDYQEREVITIQYLTYAQKIQDPILLLDASEQRGLSYFVSSSFDSSIFWMVKAHGYAKNLKDTASLVKIKRRIGVAFLKLNKLDSASKCYRESLVLATLSDNKRGMAMALNNIGVINREFLLFEDALHYFTQALDLKITYADDLEIISTINNIGSCYMELREYDNAYKYIYRGVDMSRRLNIEQISAVSLRFLANLHARAGKSLDAEKTFKESFELSFKIKDYATGFTTKIDLINFYLGRKQWLRAEIEIEQLLALQEINNSVKHLALLNYAKGKVKFETNDYLNSKIWLRKVTDLEGVKMEKPYYESYYLLSTILYKEGKNEQAYNYLQNGKKLQEIIINKLESNRLKELQLKYENQYDQSAVNTLTTLLDVKEKEKENFKLFSIIVGLVLCLALILLVFLFFQIRFKNKKSEELTKQVAENLRKTKELEIANTKAVSGLKAKSEFISMVSHELKTPMNVVVGTSAVLSETKLNLFQKDQLNNIIISSNNLLTLLNDILDFTKLESNKLEIHTQPTSITELVKNVVNLFEIKARNKGIVFLVSLDENLPSIVFVDSLRLRQVLINLLDNAFKFTHQGKVCIILK